MKGFEEQESDRCKSDRLVYTVLFNGKDDVTHFRDEYFLWDTRENGNATTRLVDASRMGFLRLPEDFRSEWHPAPRKQFVMVLEGVMEVEAGDGERRTFSSGSVLKVTDTGCRGHRTNTLNRRRVMLVWVPV